MSQFGISIGYEKDKCSICKKPKEIRYIYDKENMKFVRVCDECVSNNSSITTQELMDKYGKKTTEKHIKILSKEQLEKSGFELTGLKDKSA